MTTDAACEKSWRASHRAGLLSWSVATALALASHVQAADARDDRFNTQTSFDIPSQALGNALKQLADQAGIQILFEERLVSGLQAPALKAHETALQALATLLQGTGLEFAAKNQTVALRKKTVVSASSATSVTPGKADGYDPHNTANTGNARDSGAHSVAAGDASKNARRVTAHRSSSPHDNRGEFAGSNEIIVTAQRRAERLVDVPMSISAVSAQDLVASGISSTGDLQQLTPGLITTNVGLSFTPAIRGVTSVSTSPGDETNIALYLDDVYIGASIAGLFELQDTERIEILKGPQGTLFGRNATGGAIRIVTKSPSFTPEAEMSADYGFSFDRWKIGGYGTTPLNDKIAVSLAMNFIDDDGYVKGVGPDIGKRYAVEHSVNTRGKVLFKADDDLSLTLAGDYTQQRNSGIYAWVPRAENFLTRNTPGAVIGGDYEYSGSVQPIADLQTWGTSLTADWNANDLLSIRSITALREARGLYQTDTDRISLHTSGLRLRQNQRNFSQEIVLSTRASRTVSAVGGLYYYHSRAWNPYFNAYLGDPPNATIASSFTNNVITNSYAAFGELTWTPIERLHLTGGARYTRETKDIDFDFLVRAAGPVSASDDRTWSSNTFRGVVRYDLTDDSNVYASVSNGFKTGVFNAYAYPLVAVSPEKITAYEIGVKGQFSGLTASLAAFTYDYRDIQVQSQTQVGGVFLVTLTNAAKSKIHGFEGTLAGRLGTHVRFDLGASYIPTAKYSSYPSAQVFVPVTNGNMSVVPFDASGSRAISTPKFQGNARLSYNADVVRGRLDASVSYAYNSGFYFQPGNLSEQKAYDVVNARIAWTEPSERWTFAITGENLSNERYSFYTTASLVGTVEALAQPREVSLGVSTRF